MYNKPVSGPINIAGSDDIELIQAIQRGTQGQREAALGELYDRYGRLIYSLAVRMIGEPALAEEITQDVFVLVWNKAHTYQPDLGKVVTWLTSMGRNRTIDMLRRQRVRPEGHRAEWTDGMSPSLKDDLQVETRVEVEQGKRRLRTALATLPIEQQKVLALAYFGGLSHQEIADTLGEPLGTVKTRLRLGVQKLRALLVDEVVSL
jgi:RNA polymerase sigma-70 factor (ECF subfamily)